MTERKRDPYSLKKPCANCPFLKDEQASIRKHLHRDRVPDIIDGLIYGRDSGFSCHKTTNQGYEDDDGNYVPFGNELECAGALILLEKMNRPTQLMRIMERVGGYDRNLLIPAHDLVIDPEDLEDM